VQRGLYTVFDPVFATIGWTPRSNFPGLAAPPAPAEIEYDEPDLSNPPARDPNDPGPDLDDDPGYPDDSYLPL